MDFNRFQLLKNVPEPCHLTLRKIRWSSNTPWCKFIPLQSDSWNLTPRWLVTITGSQILSVACTLLHCVWELPTKHTHTHTHSDPCCFILLEMLQLTLVQDPQILNDYIYWAPSKWQTFLSYISYVWYSQESVWW